jgi:hypothetical protein
MDSYDLKKIVNSYVSTVKTRNHIDNPYVHFSVTYYVVKSNNEVIVSPSDSVLSDFEWALIFIVYCHGQNYRGYFDSASDTNFITKEGIIVPKLRVGNLEVHKELQLCSIDNQFLYSPENSLSREDKIKDICKIMPLIQGCRSFEQADMIISIKRKSTENSEEENVVNTLMEEIRRLRTVISNYEDKFEQIKGLLSLDVTNDNV